MPTKRQFSIQVTEEQLEVLDKLSEEIGCSRSTLVTQLIGVALRPGPQWWAVPFPKGETHENFLGKAVCPVCKSPAVLAWFNQDNELTTVSCPEPMHWPRTTEGVPADGQG